jgi:aspartate aminotransferase-like enzyme
MINHRGPEFAELIEVVAGGLKTAFETENDLVVLTCSGTGGLEAAVTNILSPGERTMVISIGVFGDRVAEIATAYGAVVVRVGFPHGSAADPDKVREALRAEPSVNTVFVTHNETSTGVTNDLEILAGVIKGEFDKTLIVDGISSIGSIPCRVDAWGIDIAVSGSQKGWMAPPGLTMVSVSQRAWEAVERSKMPKYYLDLVKARDSLAKDQTPWTPGISTLYGLRVGLELILAEGLEYVHERHARVGSRTRRMVEGMGFELFAESAHASDTVTAVKIPEGMDWKAISGHIRQQHGVVLAGGQGSLSGKIFRIGHMGWVTDAEIDQVGESIKSACDAVSGSSVAAG